MTKPDTTFQAQMLNNGDLEPLSKIAQFPTAHLAMRHSGWKSLPQDGVCGIDKHTPLFIRNLNDFLSHHVQQALNCVYVMQHRLLLAPAHYEIT